MDKMAGRRPDREAVAEDTLSLAGDMYFQNKRNRLERRYSRNYNERRPILELYSKSNLNQTQYQKSTEFKRTLINKPLPLCPLQGIEKLNGEYFSYAFDWVEMQHSMGLDYSIRLWD